MPYSIPSSTKILSLTRAPFLFISVGALSVKLLCGQECIFYCAPRKKRYTLLPEGTDIYTHSPAQSSKRFKPLSLTVLLRRGNC